MAALFLRNFNLHKQYSISFILIVAVSVICYLLSSFVGYRSVALLLMVTVSVIAMFSDIKPVILAAVLSALIWNFFFIPPRFTLAIRNTEDVLMFLMYFVIALVNAVLTTKIRKIERVANKKIEEENTLKLYSTLFNSLSHELKTPISTIIGASDNLQAMSDKLSEHDKYELASEISKAGIQLNRQVGNLLNMSRLESGFIKPKTDWIYIGELVHDVIGQLKDVLGNKPVHVVISDNLPLFKVDEGLLSQVLYNLLHNAAIYIPKYAVIAVRVTCKADKLIIVVEDTGEGFPADEINKVFDKFYRLKNSKTGGTGLGLSIVKGFVEAMSGTITLKNMPEGGAVFTIELPAELSYVYITK